MIKFLQLLTRRTHVGAAASRLFPRGSGRRRWTVEEVVNERYDLNTPQGLSSVAEAAKKSLDETGVALLPGFLKPAAVTAAASEVNARLRDHVGVGERPTRVHVRDTAANRTLPLSFPRPSLLPLSPPPISSLHPSIPHCRMHALAGQPVFFTHTKHNIFLDDAKSGKEAPVGRDQVLHSSFHRTDVGSVAWDELHEDSPLRCLYNWSGVLDLLSHIQGKTKHRLGDPLGACTVNVFRPEMEQ